MYRIKGVSIGVCKTEIVTHTSMPGYIAKPPNIWKYKVTDKSNL